MNKNDYVHGYSEKENERLFDQANTLAELLHIDTIYPPENKILEAGCGVGAQTIILAKNNPNAQFTSIDISAQSLQEAKSSIDRAGISNVDFQLANIFNLPFEGNTFDHVFICFVLEHIKEPANALDCLKKVLKPGGSITVIEGDHGSAYYYPESKWAQKAIDCLVEIQARGGGNALIGRQLYPLLGRCSLKHVKVTPRQVYCDSSKPEWVEGFTKKTFIAMVEGIKESAIKEKLIESEEWDRGISDLYASAGPDGTFNYTFFKAVGIK
jgi:ubiquinone/menaquinone biosynthesis C-methylase UbiE